MFPVAALKKFRQTMEARMHLTGEPIDDFKTVYDRFAQAYNLATARDDSAGNGRWAAIPIRIENTAICSMRWPSPGRM